MIKYALIASVFALSCGSSPLGIENNDPDSGGSNAPDAGGATSQGSGGSANSIDAAHDSGGVTGSDGSDNTGGDTSNSADGATDAGNDTSADGNNNDSNVPPPICMPASCVLTQGYWKNHPDWTARSLEMGGATYTKDECLALLNFPSYTDGSVILAKQLIAALLNGGACDPNIAATVQIAQDWMAVNKDTDGSIPYGTICASPEDPGCIAINIGSDLDRYNNGQAGTPACK